MNSCIYRGAVRHRRFSPVPHAFRYRVFMMYLDLAEIPRVFDGRWLWSARRHALASFRRADHFGDPQVPLDQTVRDLVLARTGRRPEGPIRLLTNLRYFGYIQNPVCFYYCFADDGVTLEAMVAEVTNTPWGDRHAYVVPVPPGATRVYARMPKALHVSPFMPMDQMYVWHLTIPADRLTIHMENHATAARVFDATMVLERQPLDGASLARILVRHPAMTVKIVAAIYWQALRLRLKRVPFHVHPRLKHSDEPAV